MPIVMEGTRPLRGQPYPTLNHTGLEGTRPPSGASPTQPYKCGQYVKVKIKTVPAVVDFDFKILTAFIRLGRVRPKGAGYPPYS